MTRANALMLFLALALPLVGCGAPTAQDLIVRAEERFQANDVIGAIEVIEQVQAMDLEPALIGQAGMLAGKYHLFNHDLPAAQEEFNHVYETLGVANPDAMLATQARIAAINVIRSWQEMGQPETAWTVIETTSPTLMRDPSMAMEFTLMAAMALEQMNQPDAALREINALIARETSHDAAFHLLGQASRLHLMRGNRDAAADLYLQYADAHPDLSIRAFASFNAGMCYANDDTSPALRAKRDALMTQAMDLFEELRLETPDPSQKGFFTVQKATAAFAMDKLTLAEDYLTTVAQTLAINPEIRYIALKGLAEFRTLDEDYDAAAEIYRRIQQEFGLESPYGMEATRGIMDVNRRIAEQAVLGRTSTPGPETSPEPPTVEGEEAAVAPRTSESLEDGRPLDVELSESDPFGAPADDASEDERAG